MGTTLTTLVTGLLVLGLLACSPAAANENAGTMHRTLGAGTLIRATTQGVLSSRRNRAGEILTALVSGDVEDARGQVVIPAGSRVPLRIARLDGTIALEVTSVTVRDQEYLVSSRVEPPHLLQRHGTGIVVGTVLGRITSPGSRGDEAGVVRRTRWANSDVVVPPGTALLFVLPQPLTVAVR
jgi:hypothetical protein